MQFRRMSVESLKSIFDIAAVALLFLTFAAGAGVLITGNIINRRQEEKLRKFDGDLTAAKTDLAIQQERAANADARAKDADARIAEAQRGSAEASERATKAQGSLALAEQHSAEANAKAEGFRLDIAKANERAASANESAEKERLARLQLEARLADRTLSPAQQAAITARLSSMSGTVVDVLIVGDTTEIQTISFLILDSLAKAGWKVQRGQAVGGGMAVKGLLVGTATEADSATSAASAALISALQSVGLAAGPWPYVQLRPPTAMMNSGFSGTAPIRFFIGSKP